MVDSAAGRLEVLRTIGVVNFLRVNGDPAPIPDSQIESIQTVIAHDLPISTCGFIQIGQKVRIRGGAMNGVEGILSASKGSKKFVISVDLLRQSLEITVDGYTIESV
jgi:transcription antitermination factor NusG